MPSLQHIDWTKMPQAQMTKKQVRRFAKMKAKDQQLRREAGVPLEPSKFNPILPNRDRYKLQHELSILNLQIKEFKNKQRQVVKDIKEIDRRCRQQRLNPVSLYALELEDGHYYIGMTFDVGKRFRQHGGSKGAAWTKLHKPISIIETRVTEFYDQDEVAKLEDDMTLEYALKYGLDKVRGGGYCQAKPVWPDVILQNEMNYATSGG